MTESTAETFKKRSGCTDRGKDYEHIYITVLILKLITENNVKNFQLSSNDDSCGVFDDVVVLIEYTNGTKQMYAIQLKHINKGKTLTKSGLAEKKGAFAIKKYYEDFSRSTFAHPTMFVLFTNLKFNVPDNETLTLSGDTFNVQLKIDRQEELLKTGTTGRCYKFKASGSVYEDFFNNFFLYTDQINVDKLKTEAASQFNQFFKCDDTIFEQVLNFVTHWSLLEGNKDKLNKNFMISTIALRVLSPQILPLKFSDDAVNDNTKLLRDAMLSFQVTCFKEQREVSTLWRDKKIGVDLQELNRTNRKYQITSEYIDNLDDLNDKDCTKLLWLMDLVPLTVSSSEALERVLTLSENFRFVVFGTVRSNQAFCKLSDLDQEMFDKICKHFRCSLQGKDNISLKDFVHNRKILPLVTTNELLQMSDVFRIGEKKEILPIPHIDRMLTRNMISMDFFNKTKDVIVVSNVKSEDEQKIRNSFITNVTLTKIEDFWKKKFESVDKENTPGKEIFFSAYNCRQQEVEDICKKLNKTIYHQFRIFEEEMEWVRSSGDVTLLKEFRVDGKSIEQKALFDKVPDNKVNIVCADPGMGKSILMKNLKNTSKLWTLLLQPKDHTKYFRKKNTNAEDFIKYIVGKTYSDDFVTRLVNILVEDRQVVFIWDGLDEVAEENLKVILSVIAELSSRGYIQWLTSRCNLKNTLENKFNVLSRSIEQFDSEQQNGYIEKRLNCTGSDLDDIKKKIHKCIRLVQYNDILGIPLQIYMFTELFRQNPEKYRKLLCSVFSITDLYRHFVDEKFNIYHQIKTNLTDCNDVIIEIMERDKTERLKQYEEAAVKTCLKSDVLEALKIDCDSFLSFIATKCDSVGIIVDVTEDKIPSFLHNSYGEYFVASFLRKNYKRVPNFASFIFEEAYNNIRFLFDLLMAEGCAAHVAVLYKNMAVLQNHEDQLECKDAGGRNPLHLASSWGRRFSPQNQKQEDHDVEDHPEYVKILAFLSERCDPTEDDELFRMNAFYYGDHAFCLLPVLVLSNKHRFDFSVLKNFNDMDTILENAVKYDLADVVEDIPFVTLNGPVSLLQRSVMHGSINCLRKMLANFEYQKTINDPDKDGITCFLRACHNGHLEILKVLMAAGADPTATTSSGFSGIYLAARGCHINVLEYLVESLDINFRNQFGKTALHVACENMSLNVARMLITFGADVNCGDFYGYTPLYLACRHVHEDVIDLLLDNDADVNVANHHEDRPLFMAAWKGQLQIVERLLDKGADINGVNKKGHAAIHAACINKMEEVLSFLIVHNADVNVPNKFGQTPLHLSVRHHFKPGIVMLLREGADVEARNGYRQTFWDVVLRSYHKHEIEQMVVAAKGREYWSWFKEKFDTEPEQTVVAETKKKCTIS